MIERYVISLALAAYCAAIIVLALTPTADIHWVEIIIAALAGLAFIGLVAHTFALTLPGDRYAYLVTGFVGLTTAIAYAWDAADPANVKIPIVLLLITGVIGSFSAHLVLPGGEEG